MESNSRSKFKKICVFCGSNPGHRKVFSDAAIDLGNELVSLDSSILSDLGSIRDLCISSYPQLCCHKVPNFLQTMLIFWYCWCFFY